jgi:hypothetical protein
MDYLFQIAQHPGSLPEHHLAVCGYRLYKDRSESSLQLDFAISITACNEFSRSLLLGTHMSSGRLRGTFPDFVT